MKRLVVLLGSVSVLALAAACGSSSESASTTAAEPTTTSTTAAGGAGGATTTAAGGGGGVTTTAAGGAGGAGGGETTTACDAIGVDLGGAPTCGVMPAAPKKPTITLSLLITDFTSMAPVQGLTVKACARDDKDCAKPLATKTTAPDGTVSVDVPTGAKGFDGFAEITGAKIVPELLFPANPLVDDAQFATGVASPNTLNLLSIIYQTDIDASRGAIAAIMSDCAGGSAGLTLAVGSSDGCTLVGYTDKNLPSKDATATDATGVGFALNVPPGDATIASKRANGDVLGKTAVFVRKGTLTAVSLTPTP